MKRQTFKTGQTAYEVSPDKGVLLTKLKPTDCEIYTVLGQAEAYTSDGRIFADERLPSLFLANEENYKALCGLFGEDAVPKLPPSPNEIMIELLKGGSHIALASNLSYEAARKNKNTLLIESIESYDENSGYFYSNNYRWEYVIAVDSRGNEITELPE